MADLKKVIIKMLVIDDNMRILDVSPIVNGFAVAKGVEKEWFKECARRTFEKILDEWEEENGTETDRC